MVKEIQFQRSKQRIFAMDENYNVIGDWECRDDFVQGYNEAGDPRGSLPDGVYTNVSAEVTNGAYGADQLTMFVDSPLIGANVEELGVRFPDMSEIYDKKLQEILRQTAKEIGLDLKEGIYCQFKGPNYESPAEVHAAKILGASAVGMSTGCEAIAANHMGMQICGISCVTNMAAGMSENPLSHQEVQENAAKAAPYIRRLLHESVLKMHKELNK